MVCFNGIEIIMFLGNSELVLENRDDGFKITFKVNGESVIVFNEKNLLVVENVLREKNENYGKFGF